MLDREQLERAPVQDIGQASSRREWTRALTRTVTARDDPGTLSLPHAMAGLLRHREVELSGPAGPSVHSREVRATTMGGPRELGPKGVFVISTWLRTGETEYLPSIGITRL
jgi:hypothetical protein